MEDGTCGSSKSITRVTKCLKQVCINGVRRLERKGKMRIGGRTAFVAIDESKFRHKRKVRQFGMTAYWMDWIVMLPKLVSAIQAK